MGKMNCFLDFFLTFLLMLGYYPLDLNMRILGFSNQL